MRRLPKALSVTLVVGMLLAASAAPASAVTWTAGTAFTGTAGTVTMSLSNGHAVTCQSSALSGTTANPASADATMSGPTGVTFSSCVLSTGHPVQIATAGTWTLRANSTGSVTIKVPASGATLKPFAAGIPLCTWTLGQSDYAATWSNVLRQLSPSVGSVPYASSGGFCGPAGTLTLSTMWAFTPTSLQIS